MDKQYLTRQLMRFFDQYQAGIDWRPCNTEFKVHTLNKGDCLLQQGEPCSNMFFLCSGLVRYYSVSQNGKEYTQTIAKAPKLVGSTRALGLVQPALFNIEAVCPSVAISFPWQSFYQQMSQDLAFTQAYAKFLESIFIAKEQKEYAMVKHSATQRYLDFCRDFSELKDVLPQQHIASYIGITPIALSRIRAQLKNNAC
ncbi:Crp/Fnr family transcriptional regulator [Marinomonas ostreistagni]|uniref:Crp/Fnr family transcriptional regulator n=1 Tax=Marinomonas ostreistagni TaxID=359209 RepID=UPI001950344F|nr:Crp/Fnr family transcriptional regulator [Marinomonas ostreistagni]MBM6552130.1 Crp/Fnr family transcriptional regulator [Marinomonas ostreistagni]